MTQSPLGFNTTLSVEDRIGLAFVVEAATLSIFAPLTLIIYLVYSAAKDRARPEGPTSLTQTSPSYFRSHLHYYFISLLFADVAQGLGGFLDVKWVSRGVVTGGPYCTAQGALKQVGDVGVALSILAIAVHTFLVLFFHWTPPESTRWAVVVLTTIWTFVVLVVSIAYGVHSNTDYYGITGLWCWITEAYPVERIALEYFWLWSSAFVNILLYILLYFALRGNIIVSQSARIAGWFPRISIRARRSHVPWVTPEDGKLHTRAARVMLFYPLIYIITILPTSVARFMAFSGYDVPSQATIACAFLFSCSGIFNVILFTLTRPAFRPLSSYSSRPPVPTAVSLQCLETSTYELFVYADLVTDARGLYTTTMEKFWNRDLIV